MLKQHYHTVNNQDENIIKHSRQCEETCQHRSTALWVALGWTAHSHGWAKREEAMPALHDFHFNPLKAHRPLLQTRPGWGRGAKLQVEDTAGSAQPQLAHWWQWRDGRWEPERTSGTLQQPLLWQAEPKLLRLGQTQERYLFVCRITQKRSQLILTKLDPGFLWYGFLKIFPYVLLIFRV